MTAVVPVNEQFTPKNIRFKQFTTVRRGGFDPHEVGQYLYQLAAELSRRDEVEAHLRARAEEATRALRQGQASGQLERRPSPQAAAIISRAQQAADDIVARAQEQATGIVSDARRRASGVLAHAETITGDGILSLTADLLGSGNHAADVRERAQGIEEADARIRIARQQLLDELEDLQDAVVDARTQLLGSEELAGDPTGETPMP